MCLQVHVDVESRGQLWVSVPSHYLLWILRQSLSSLDLAKQVSLTSQQIPRLHLSLPPSSGIQACVNLSSIFYVGPGNRTQVLARLYQLRYSSLALKHLS